MFRACQPRLVTRAAASSKLLGRKSVHVGGLRLYQSAPVSPKIPSKHIGSKFTWQVASPLAGTCLAGCALAMCIPRDFWLSLFTTQTANCEAAAVVESLPTSQNPSVQIEVKVKGGNSKDSFRNKMRRMLRILRRILKLTLTLSPIVALYPLQYIITTIRPLTEKEMEDAHEIALATVEGTIEIPDGPVGWYYRMCLYCIECSGAAAIKMMQWAGSRPDMFGETFCSVFSQLQDDTTPHSWKYTEKILQEAYGDEWKEHIRLDKIIGSGCIAQVYKGVVIDEDGQERPVAVKVMHPNVENDIDADLDIMRLAVQVVEHLPFEWSKNLKWLNFPGIVEELAEMLKIQLDLRTEAEHLNRFNDYFKDNDLVVFPELVEGHNPSKELLVETFCEGEPIMDFIRTNKQDPEVLHEMCVGAVKTVCKMIFVHNFTHGDLHPGNVLVNKNNQFVLLDVGIVIEHNKRDHRLISDVLASFIRKDGRKAGRKMMADSTSRLGENTKEDEKFLDTIEEVTLEAHAKGYLMEKLGKYITIICNAAARHHVMLNQAFVSTALAVKVQEGIALALDPSIEIWRVAIPVILEGERKHGYIAHHAKEVMGLNRVGKWLRDMVGSSSRDDEGVRH